MTQDIGYETRKAPAKLLDFVNPQKPQSFRACRDLHAYWDALRGARMMPSRMEFDPRGIESSLNSTFIAERVAPRVARIRVAGSKLNEALGMDVRGMPITAFFAADDRDDISEALRAFFAEPSVTRMSLTARRGFARKPVAARALLLPLSDADGDLTRMVGCFDTGDITLTHTSRFSVTQIERKPLQGLAAKPQETTRLDRPRPEPSHAFAFAESPAQFQTSRKAPTAGQHERTRLRLVVDNG